MSGKHPLEVFDLLFQINKVDELLDCVSTLLIATNCHKITRYPFQNLHALVTRAVYQQSLTEVVAVVINHYLRQQTLDFIQQKLDYLWVRIVQKLLKELASSLIYSQLNNVTFE